MSINHLTVETEDTFASLLEFAANNDVQGMKRWIERDPSGIDEVGLWYGRQNGSKQMVLEHRTPLMVAANYGSIDVLKLILSLPEVDVNRPCGRDKSTPLHSAASGGSVNCVDTVKLLLEAGADPKLVDANGNHPLDVIVVVSQNLQDNVRSCLENLLRFDDAGNNASSMPERKEFPFDPSLPDIKNSVYSTDEFRMFSFKIRPCSRAYSHDWTECPFLHPGENARRRDPRKYHYSCVPCPEFRNKGACRRGDMCEYAHGVFESWLHPAQYRTRLCKDGTKCNRRVCFFAHTHDELRPLYVSTGSAVPSPMSPSNNGISNMGWPQQNSRSRSSFYAREEVNMFCTESSSPRYCDQALAKSCFSPTHKSAVLNQFQLQQSMLSPINTNPSPKCQNSFGVSPLASHVSLLSHHEKQKQFRSLSFNSSAAVVSPVDTWPKWGANSEAFGKLIRRSSSFEQASNGEEPDLSWVQCLVKESPQEAKDKPANAMTIAGASEGSPSNSQIEHIDQSELSAWLEQVQFGQLLAQ